MKSGKSWPQIPTHGEVMQDAAEVRLRRRISLQEPVRKIPEYGRRISGSYRNILQVFHANEVEIEAGVEKGGAVWKPLEGFRAERIICRINLAWDTTCRRLSRDPRNEVAIVHGPPRSARVRRSAPVSRPQVSPIISRAPIRGTFIDKKVTNFKGVFQVCGFRPVAAACPTQPIRRGVQGNGRTRKRGWRADAHVLHRTLSAVYGFGRPGLISHDPTPAPAAPTHPPGAAPGIATPTGPRPRWFPNRPTPPRAPCRTIAQ